MATHSSVLAWRIPGMGEPGGLPSMGSHRVRHDWSDLAAAAEQVKRCSLMLLERASLKLLCGFQHGLFMRCWPHVAGKHMVLYCVGHWPFWAVAVDTDITAGAGLQTPTCGAWLETSFSHLPHGWLFKDYPAQSDFSFALIKSYQGPTSLTLSLGISTKLKWCQLNLLNYKCSIKAIWLWKKKEVSLGFINVTRSLSLLSNGMPI